MTRLARFLRRIADLLDPPGPLVIDWTPEVDTVWTWRDGQFEGSGVNTTSTVGKVTWRPL